VVNIAGFAGIAHQPYSPYFPGKFAQSSAYFQIEFVRIASEPTLYEQPYSIIL